MYVALGYPLARDLIILPRLKRDYRIARGVPLRPLVNRLELLVVTATRNTFRQPLLHFACKPPDCAGA